MIGDWVSYCGFYNKVIYIGQKVSMYDGKGTEFTTDPEHIRPIPLTESILVKNGFENVRDNLVFTLKNLSSNVKIGITLDDESTVYLIENETGTWPGFNYYDLFEIKYVHTLQHLLRLVGVQKEIEL